MPHSPRPRRGCRMTEEEMIEALNEIAARFREQHLYGYEHVVNAVALIVQQQAQIARVRQVLDEEQRGYNPPLGLISRIKTALEGDSDD